MKIIGLFKSIQSWGLGTERHKANYSVIYLCRVVFMQRATSPLTNFQEVNIFNFFFFWLDHDKQKIDGRHFHQQTKSCYSVLLISVDQKLAGYLELVSHSYSSNFLTDRGVHKNVKSQHGCYCTFNTSKKKIKVFDCVVLDDMLTFLILPADTSFMIKVPCNHNVQLKFKTGRTTIFLFCNPLHECSSDLYREAFTIKDMLHRFNFCPFLN